MKDDRGYPWGRLGRDGRTLPRVVVKRADIAALPPKALVKFNMHCAGIELSEEEPGRKRKRDGE